MNRCIIYCRVSTDAQERDGTSLESQERACTDFAAGAGWIVAEHIRDTASGFTLDRPGIDRLRDLIRSKAADVVLTYAVDRLSRNQNQIGVLFDEANQLGVRLDFVTEKFEDTAVGRFILAARAFVAEVEREKILERTQRGKTARAKAGKLPQATGRGMYGYVYSTLSGRREINPAEAAIVLQVFERFAIGASCNGIACGLNDARIPAFGGGQWYPLTIRRMLLNESYTGRTVFRRTRTDKYRDGRTGRTKRVISKRDQAEWIEIDGATPRVVSPELFAKASAILSDPDRRNRARPTRAYPLTGRLRCAACGAPMVGQVLMKGRYAYYRCRSRYIGRSSSTCPSKYMRSDALESAVRDALIDVLSDPARVLAEAERLADLATPTDELTSVMQSLQDIEAKQRRLVRLFTDGDLPPSMLEEQRTELSRRRLALEAERNRLESAIAPTLDLDHVKRSLPEVVRQIREWIANAEGDKLSLLLNAVDAHVLASGSDVQIRGVIPAYEASVGSDLATIERTSGCVFNARQIAGVPFELAVSLAG